MPLVVLFGAYRRYELDPPPDPRDIDLLARIIRRARHYKVPLGFARRVDAEARAQPGAWLPGCRPRTQDRVYDHRALSAFDSREFHTFFMTAYGREIQVAGPADDSSMQATMADAEALGRPVSVIRGENSLHICSAMSHGAAAVNHIQSQYDHHCTISIGAWETSLRVIEPIN